MNRRIILWILTILWAAMIFAFSAQPATNSTEMSKSVTEQILETVPSIRSLPPEEKTQMVAEYETIVRKLAHFALYTVLGILLYALAKSYPISPQKAFLLAFLACVLYAASDEWHQYYVPGRSAEFLDIAIDSGGSLLGIILYQVVKKLSHKKA